MFTSVNLTNYILMLRILNLPNLIVRFYMVRHFIKMHETFAFDA